MKNFKNYPTLFMKNIKDRISKMEKLQVYWEELDRELLIFCLVMLIFLSENWILFVSLFLSSRNSIEIYCWIALKIDCIDICRFFLGVQLKK